MIVIRCLAASYVQPRKSVADSVALFDCQGDPLQLPTMDQLTINDEYRAKFEASKRQEELSKSMNVLTRLQFTIYN